MQVKELEVINFRNYEFLNIKFHKKTNLILGDNAQGKTNLLESIYIASLGKSFRTTKDNEMIRFGAEFCKVKLLAEREESEKTVEMVIREKEKAIKKDGVKIRKTAELVNHMLVVVFSPEDLKMVKESPEKRRRFMDRELCQIKPSYYANLAFYKRALQQRNACLREKEVKDDLLEVWGAQLAAYGSKIIAARKKFVEKISRFANEIHKEITNGKENLEIFYEMNVPFLENAREQEEMFRAALEKGNPKDRMQRATSTGPHRDDLLIHISGIDSKRFGSQGQQRSAALSIKLAELALIEEETGEKAILLLDDVLSELDAGRQTFLIQSARSAQVFITAAEISPAVQKALQGGRSYHVKEGKISAL